jgi:peptide deformylase
MKESIIKRIYPYGEKILRQKTQPVTEFNEWLKDLSEEMAEVCALVQGIGLAAPQVGQPISMAMVKIEEEGQVIVNPRIVSASDEEYEDEGCLSFPGLSIKVKRPTKIEIVAQDLTGKEFTMQKEGLWARALHHEIDHLEGRLFIDRIDPKWRKVMKKRQGM